MTTRDKRASSIGWGLAALLVLPAPGALDQGDRQQTAYSYRGILATPALATTPIVITVEASDRTVAVEADDRTILIPDVRG